jgi:hypothetical protein
MKNDLESEKDITQIILKIYSKNLNVRLKYSKNKFLPFLFLFAYENLKES